MAHQQQSQQTAKAGVLLVSHGTRHQKGQADFLHLAKRLQSLWPAPVEPAFLELAEPRIEQRVERLVAADIDRLVVAPLLLFAAGHAKQDVPAAVKAALLKCRAGDLPVRQASPFGCHPLILELAKRRLLEAVGAATTVSASQTLLVIVGRGSSDPSAISQLHQFADLLAQSAGTPRVQVAFMAVASPAVTDVLRKIPEEKVIRRVVVQPHLLFHGELVEELHRHVARVAQQRPRQEWLVGCALADDVSQGGKTAELLAAATMDLIEKEFALW